MYKNGNSLFRCSIVDGNNFLLICNLAISITMRYDKLYVTAHQTQLMFGCM